jgi:hypothetical protein
MSGRPADEDHEEEVRAGLRPPTAAGAIELRLKAGPDRWATVSYPMPLATRTITIRLQGRHQFSMRVGGGQVAVDVLDHVQRCVTEDLGDQ